MRRFARILSAALALLLMAGCVQRQVLLKVKPDGSGTIEDTAMFSTERKRVNGTIPLDDSKGNKGSIQIDALRSDSPPTQRMTKDEAREKAKIYGAVELDDLDDVERDGSKGQRATYKFKDVTQVRLGEFFFAGMDTLPAEEREIRTEFARYLDGRAGLTLKFPESKAKPIELPLVPEKDPSKIALSKLLKPLMKDAKLNFAIEVKGKLVKVDGLKMVPEKNRVTVLDAQLEGILDAVFMYQGLQQKEQRDLAVLAKLRQILSDVKEVRIEFVK